jgi:iron complex transport system substrate-binding protein
VPGSHTRARLLAVALLIGAACGRAAPLRSSLTVIDDAGDTVALARPASRIVSLIPATTELLFAIGAGPALVGRTDWCDAPDAALAVPSLGDGLDPNIEAIVGAGPDLVILYPSTRNATAAARLRALRLPTVQLRTDRLEDFSRAAGILGRLTGRSGSADSLVRATDSALQAATRSDSRTVSVLIVVWDQPPMTVGRGSFLHQIVERAGGRNAFGDLDGSSASVSLEAIAIRNPDVILTMSDTPPFADRPEWQVVRAVRERRFLTVGGSEFLRPSPRAPAAVARLARLLDSVVAP